MLREVGDQLGAGGTQSQDHGRVDDVLTGGAAMNVACRLGITRRHRVGQFADERNNHVTGSGRLCGQGCCIKVFRASSGLDIGHARGGNDAGFRLCNGQCDLYVEKGLEVFPIPDGRHQISKNTVSFSPCTTTLNEYSPACRGLGQQCVPAMVRH